jgi:hypothetical protein
MLHMLSVCASVVCTARQSACVPEVCALGSSPAGLDSGVAYKGSLVSPS